MNAFQIYKIFRMYPEIFPHIRYDYIFSEYESGNIIIKNNIIIIIHVYKKKTKIGNKKGDLSIRQILNLSPGNGEAHKVLQHIFDIFKCDTYLTVRSNNSRAINFYKKMGFSIKGIVHWKRNTIIGFIMKRKHNG